MTRKSHDQLAKQYLAELLTPIGKVETSFDISSEVRQVDVWFVPASPLPPDISVLGLLGQMVSSACMLEVFRNPPTLIEVRTCQLKLYGLHGELLRQARREKNSFKEADLPFLWILTPTSSTQFLNSFGAESDSEWVQGVYFLAPAQKTAIVAINQLPVTEETLWLRVLGRGGTQQRAVEELVKLPIDNPLREKLLEILVNWRTNLELKADLTDEDRELIMDLSPAYLQRREEWRIEGIREGIQAGIREGRSEGRREMIENLLRVRFGEVDENLQRAIALMLQLPTEELTRLLLTVNREELLARF